MPSTHRSPNTRARLLATAAALALPACAVGVAAAPAGAMSMAGMPGTAHAAAATVSSAAVASSDGMASMVHVGTNAHPLIADGPAGPLWTGTEPDAPGTGAHGTFAAITVAREIAIENAERSGTVASQIALAYAAGSTTTSTITVAQATKKLSKTCQRLIKARTSTPKSADRKRRTACLKQRSKLLAAPAASTTVPGVTAPEATIKGPAPVATTTTAAATTTPAATTTDATVTATTPAATTPVTSGPGTPDTPVAAPPASDGKVYAAITAIAKDNSVPFTLTHATVAADVVAFGLENTDRQPHNLSLRAVDATGTPVGPRTEIVPIAYPGQNLYANVALQPGVYDLECEFDGHEPMAVKITVVSPR